MSVSGNAHLVGSVPLGDTEEVLRAVAGTLGHQLRRLPDGETGARGDWIRWQRSVLADRPEIEPCPPGHHPQGSLPPLRLRDPRSAATLTFDLGYAAAARASYQVFARLKRDGVVPGHCKFQVSLPTPLAPVSAFVAERDQATIEPLYERQLLVELAEILAELPHDELAIQWDVNFEFAMLDGLLPSWFTNLRDGVLERLVRVGRLIPSDVELGYHFCHGHDLPHLPHGRDMRTQVEVANALVASLDAPLTWLHLAVPTDRLDAEDFEPLAYLSLPNETELSLGLIQIEDGELGASARCTVARRYVRNFGIATACGWGRWPARHVPKLLALHASLAQVVEGPTKRPAFS